MSPFDSNSMDQQIFSDLEHKIEVLFSKKKKDRAVYDRYLEFSRFNDVDLFLSLSKVSMLIFKNPDYDRLTSKDYPRVDINAPILEGMFPLHLAVLTSSCSLVRNLIIVYDAKLDVKCCGDPNSPFHGLTPLEMALGLMRNPIPWTPQLSVHELLSMFHENQKAELLLDNISKLMRVTPFVRDIICNYSLQGKVVELAALLMVCSSYHINFSTIYVPSAKIPPGLHFGVPMMLRVLVASKSVSLIKEGIQISSSLNPEEDDNQRRKIKEMDSIRILLESAERGDLDSFDEKQQLTVELTDGSSEGSQDESNVDTVAPQYLKHSLFYVEPSIFKPHGILNSLMPRGYYDDSLDKYDGLDIRNSNALVETIFRVLHGKKVEELSLADTYDFRFNLAYCLKYKFKEAETLTAFQMKRAKIQVKEKKRATTRLSLPRGTTKRTTAALTTGGPGPVIEAFEHLDVKKISSAVFSAIKKVRP